MYFSAKKLENYNLINSIYQFVIDHLLLGAWAVDSERPL
jgi:hypothetical protein